MRRRRMHEPSAEDRYQAGESPQGSLLASPIWQLRLRLWLRRHEGWTFVKRMICYRESEDRHARLCLYCGTDSLTCPAPRAEIPF